uniref:Putative outer membrane hemin receptor n=1 Tax=symbiont bacterium of Paederus fuscipes TaxID=176282 RepID=Q6TAB2_UNCXX|nr:putative outer membrane hemin receptor [symbiont bacterium of Paederus fuscipes]
MPLAPPFAFRPWQVLMLLSPSLALADSVVPLTPTTITATRTEQAVDSVPNTVNVQTYKQLDRQNINTVKDLVHYEPGVSVGGTGQRAGISGFNIRGIDGDRILTQIDGVEVPNNFFNGSYAQTHRNYIDPNIIKSVEILRGPSSALYGSNAIGGAVSYFTLDPSDIIKDGKKVGARLKVGYSSANDSWLTSATVASRADSFDALLHYGYRNGHETASHGSHSGTGLSRTKANPEDFDSYSVLGKLGWDYTEGSRFGLVLEKFESNTDTDQKSAYGGPYFNGQPIVPPSLLPAGMYQWRKGNDRITRERYGLENHFLFDGAIAERIQWSLNYQLAKTAQSTHELYYPIRRKALRTRDTTYKERLWVFDSQLDKSFSFGQTDHLLSYGVNLKHLKVSSLRSGNAIDLDIGDNSPGDGLLPTSDFPNPIMKTFAVFTQDNIEWNDWAFIPGLRHDYTRLAPHITDEFLRSVQQNDNDNDVVDDSTKKWHRLSPKLGVTYDFTQHYTSYGQYAEGFRTPTAKALYGRFENLNTGYRIEPNPNLKPEKSRSFETGLRGKSDEGNFSVILFYNKYRDFINEDAVTPGCDKLTFQSNNIKQAIIKGAEFKSRLELSAFGAPQDFYIQSSIAYAYGRNKDNGQPINSVNPLTGVFAFGYDEAEDNYGGQFSWTLAKCKTRVDDSTFYAPDGTSDRFKTPGFGVLDLSGYYKLTKDLTLNAVLYNLGDKKYWLWDDVRGYDSAGEAAMLAPANLDRLTQPGRNFTANLVWNI